MERVPAGDESHQDIQYQHKYPQYLTHCKCKDQNAEVNSKCMLSLPGVKGREEERPQKAKILIEPQHTHQYNLSSRCMD